MGNEPLISIIVPVYNIQDFVLKCLKSLSKQKYQNIEIIIVDDGSTDKSGKICDDFALTEKRAKVFHKKNGGLSDARNFGIKKAKGEIIALVDGDDYVGLDYISVMYKKMKEDEEVDVVVCGYDRQLPKAGILSGKDATVRLLVEQNNTDIVAWNKLYRKTLFDDILYPVGEKHEDTLTTYKILSLARKVSYVAESLYYYIERAGSIMQTEKIEERLIARERAANEATKYFKDEKDLEKAAEVSMLLAKYAYIDAAVRGRIDMKYCKKNMLWVKKHVEGYRSNIYMTRKLKLYNILVQLNLYGAFRRFI